MDVAMREEAAICAKALRRPFCGGPASVEPWHGGKPTKRLIECANEDCDVKPSVTGETKREALALWNTRAEVAR